MFAAIRSGKASIIADTIQASSEDEIKLSSGQSLHPDIVVTATGLRLKIGGGALLIVDNQVFDPTTKFMWKSLMI